MNFVPEPRKKSQYKVLLLIAAVLLIALGWYLLPRLLSNPPQVTDTEAIQFARTISDLAAKNPDDICSLAVFNEACDRTLAQNPGEDPGGPLTVICTWTLKGDGGVQVAEVEGIDAAGEPYRTSLAVGNEDGEFTAWPLPYWLYPTRNVPEPSALEKAPPEAPNEVNTSITYDPCAFANQ